MATGAYVLLVVLVFVAVGAGVEGQTQPQSWCVGRSTVSQQQLQTALDYACSAGADCAPIQPNALCYLPNTVLSHASYAFNSYYQRRSRATGSCDFSGAATVATTDPSYGSCVYPSSSSTAGGGSNTPPGVPVPPTSGSNTPPGVPTPVPPTSGSNTPPGVPVPPTSGNVPPGQIPPPPGFPTITPGISPGTPGPDGTGSESPLPLSTSMILYCLLVSYVLLIF